MFGGKMFGNFKFGAAHGVKMSHLGLAFKNNNGEMVSYDNNRHEIVNVDIINFDCEKMVCLMPVALSAVVEGDVILHNNSPMFVIDIAFDYIEAVDINNGTIVKILPTKSPFGFNFVVKYHQMFNMDTADENNPFGNMLWPMMLSDNDKKSDSSMMKMMMFNTMMNNGIFNAGFNSQDPASMMNMFFMFKNMFDTNTGGSNDDELFTMMMMYQMQNTQMHHAASSMTKKAPKTTPKRKPRKKPVQTTAPVSEQEE